MVYKKYEFTNETAITSVGSFLTAKVLREGHQRRKWRFVGARRSLGGQDRPRQLVQRGVETERQGFLNVSLKAMIGSLTLSYFVEDIKKLNVKKSEEERGLCILCRNEPANMMFVPCNHVVACEQCYKADIGMFQSKCMMCRAPVGELGTPIRKVFIP